MLSTVYVYFNAICVRCAHALRAGATVALSTPLICLPFAACGRLMCATVYIIKPAKREPKRRPSRRRQQSADRLLHELGRGWGVGGVPTGLYCSHARTNMAHTHTHAVKLFTARTHIMRSLDMQHAPAPPPAENAESVYLFYGNCARGTRPSGSSSPFRRGRLKAVHRIIVMHRHSINRIYCAIHLVAGAVLIRIAVRSGCACISDELHNRVGGGDGVGSVCHLAELIRLNLEMAVTCLS